MGLGECVGTSDDLKALRAKYRSRWDAHQIVADQNARMTQAGKQPSDEQLIREQISAEAVQLARRELMAAIARGD